jgi:FlaA1/EpsC-like NDP-sugar epimerase
MIIIIIIIKYCMSWFNILMSNYKASTKAKVNSKRNSWSLVSAPNNIFLSNRFGPTEGIWRFRGKYKYWHKINSVALTCCLSVPSSFFFTVLLFYLIFSSAFCTFNSPFTILLLRRSLVQSYGRNEKISAADVRRRHTCVYYSIQTEKIVRCDKKL